MSNVEHEPKATSERANEIAKSAAERSRELAKQLERSNEHHTDREAHKSVEKARDEALKEALFSKEQGKEKRSPQAERHNASPVITKHDREASLKQTLSQVQKELSPPARLFSNVIHNPVIEKSSDLVGNTIARPNAILAGSISAFVCVLAVYSYARYAGFSLSGFETIGAFILGWILGVTYDFLRAMITGKR